MMAATNTSTVAPAAEAPRVALVLRRVTKGRD
jgi:hypothetical protein